MAANDIEQLFDVDRYFEVKLNVLKSVKQKVWKS